MNILIQKSDLQLNERVDAVFDEVVAPAFKGLIDQYNGVGGYFLKNVPDSPLITGIERHESILVKHPYGLEMIVCVYWVQGSERLVAENILMLTLSKTFDIYTVSVDEVQNQIKFLSGLK